MLVSAYLHGETVLNTTNVLPGMITKKRHNYKRMYLVVALLIFLFSGCASAPIQEMSDARQAISAARSVNQDESDPFLEKAESLLKQAEKSLHVGDYREARDNAKAAREQAIQAQRAIASQSDF